jgi:hypothetical protein
MVPYDEAGQHACGGTEHRAYRRADDETGRGAADQAARVWRRMVDMPAS